MCGFSGNTCNRDPNEFKVIIGSDCQLITNSINDKINVPKDISLEVDSKALYSYF